MITCKINECDEDDDESVKDLSYFKYLYKLYHVTSKKCSKYETILRKNHRRFKFKNLKSNVIISCMLVYAT